jgi:hypothetical protein
MATVHLNVTTTATPEQFVAGLTDFGPGRSELFGRSADKYLKVHDQGPDHADVPEGSWGGNSGHTYTFTRQSNGTTDLDVVVVREGKNFKGRALGIMLEIVGKRVRRHANA